MKSGIVSDSVKLLLLIFEIRIRLTQLHGSLEKAGSPLQAPIQLITYIMSYGKV